MALVHKHRPYTTEIMFIVHPENAHKSTAM